jgi:hypothetical protein
MAALTIPELEVAFQVLNRLLTELLLLGESLSLVDGWISSAVKGPELRLSISEEAQLLPEECQRGSLCTC